MVPSGELERLRETVEVISDTDAVRALADTELAVVGREAIRSLVAKRNEPARTAARAPHRRRRR